MLWFLLIIIRHLSAAASSRIDLGQVGSMREAKTGSCGLFQAVGHALWISVIFLRLKIESVFVLFSALSSKKNSLLPVHFGGCGFVKYIQPLLCRNKNIMS